MQLWKKVVLAVAGLGVAGAAAAGAIFAGVTEGQTVQAQQRDIIRAVRDTGYVQPARHYDVFITAGGRVVRLAAETGQTVREGETLLVLESPELALQIDEIRARVNQATAAIAALEAGIERTGLQLDEARENLARVELLLEAEAATQVEYQQARLQVETLERSLKEQQAHAYGTAKQAADLNQSLQRLTAMQRQLVVTSPAAGVVLNLPVKLNQTLPPGYLAATIAPVDQLEVKADILTDDLPQIAVGQKALITAPALGAETLPGEVRRIYPQAEERLSALGVTQRRVPVVIALEDSSGLKPGFEVTVAIETARREGVTAVPRQSVRTAVDGRKEVLIVDNGRVLPRPVETGISDGTYIEITSGLAPGEEIIANAGLDLAEGARVKTVGR